MACSDYKKWADKIDKKIATLDRATAIEAEKDAAIKQAITGLAKAMESIGLSVELGYTHPSGAGAKIKLQPKHTETATGAFEIWEGWQKYTQAGGKVPTAKTTRALLVKARKIALDEYRNCRRKTRKKAVWTGYVKATFTERSNRSYTATNGEPVSQHSFWEEVHTWTISGNPDASDRRNYPATWKVDVKLSYVRVTQYHGTIVQLYTETIPETAYSYSAKSHITVSEDDEGGYHITCGYDGKYAPNGVPYTKTDTMSAGAVINGSDGSSVMSLEHSEGVGEHVVGVDGKVKDGAAIGKEDPKDTLWSVWALPEEPGSTHKRSTEWSLKRKSAN